MFVGTKTMLSKFDDFDLSLVERGELIGSLLLNTSALPWTKMELETTY